MNPSTTRAALRRLSATVSLLSGLVIAMPAFGGAPACTAEHFRTGKLALPSYDEAMAQCVAQESAMTHPTSGAFETLRSCHDVGPRGSHGPWLHGRIGVDVVERDSGDRYSFEGLWMCKPVAAAITRR